MTDQEVLLSSNDLEKRGISVPFCWGNASQAPRWIQDKIIRFRKHQLEQRSLPADEIRLRHYLAAGELIRADAARHLPTDEERRQRAADIATLVYLDRVAEWQKFGN